MLFIELKKLIIDSGLELVRADTNNYFEAIILKSNLSKLNEQFNIALGPPMWPSDKQLSPEIQEIIDQFGGVRDKQTLYCANIEGSLTCIMFWPWSDGQYVTLKICRQVIGSL